MGRFRQFASAVRPPDGGAGWRPSAGSGKHTHLNGGLGLLDVGVPADAGTSYEPGWQSADDSYVVPSATNLACDAYASWTDTPASNEHLPIDCVNWYEAYAFCIWDGGFLPAEAEWEFAAADGDQVREYPWGTGFVGLPGGRGEYSV
ncbi:MAG: SUMF1/EgtB/PvdO family nonheme iron enzyme, partial [Gemmatimonadales bacterium]